MSNSPFHDPVSPCQSNNLQPNSQSSLLADYLGKTTQKPANPQVCSGPASWRVPMAAPDRDQPKYRRQARANRKPLGFVVIAGKRRYLGEYNSPESLEAYHRLLAEIAASSGIPTTHNYPLTIVELAERFVAWAQGYYRKQGHVTAEVPNILNSIKPLIKLYGHHPAAEFGPRALKVVRQTWLDQRASRKYINRNVERIRRMFKWAVAEELVPPGIYHGLQAVPGLKYGRSDALETAPVIPAPEELIEPVKRIVSRQVAAMIDLQLLTGARPGEITIMRPIDIDRSGEVWIYRPATHKTEHHGHTRIIPLGPRARHVIAPFLVNREATEYLFSPIEAERERMALRTAGRKTLYFGDSDAPRQGAPWTRMISNRYDTTAYARAIARACEEAFPLPEPLRPPMISGRKRMGLRDYFKAAPPEMAEAIIRWRQAHHWHPHQLRHNYATMIRKQHGLEAAQILLGHSKADVTQIYAERDLVKALEVACKVG